MVDLYVWRLGKKTYERDSLGSVDVKQMNKTVMCVIVVTKKTERYIRFRCLISVPRAEDDLVLVVLDKTNDSANIKKLTKVGAGCQNAVMFCVSSILFHGKYMARVGTKYSNRAEGKIACA